MQELKHCKALIIDPTGFSKALLRSLLINLGVHNVETASDSSEALLAMRKHTFTLIFCDELVTPLNPFEFLKALRRDVETRDVTVPVVLVSSGLEFYRVAAARDAGMNDVIVKPVSVETVEKKLRSLVLSPKHFVTTKAFIGPDRRRGGDRRQFGERTDAPERRANRSETPVVHPVVPRLNLDERDP
jgi:two-component system chemotaxis response regulator CheY